jgi:hypothetical protein
MVQELLEWSPTVIVAESALSDVLRWGIKIDVVVGLSENVESLKLMLSDQLPLKILSCSSEDDAVATGLYFLIASKQKLVNILSNLPLQTFENFHNLNLNVFQSGRKWSFIQSGKFEKWLPAGAIHIQSQKSETFISEKEGIVTIQRAGSFWVAEE